MQLRSFALIGAIASVVVATPALAQTKDDMSFAGMASFNMCDDNKDGMVTKKEFLDQMSKVWDMRSKNVKMVKGAMTAADYEKTVLMYLKAGG